MFPTRRTFLRQASASALLLPSALAQKEMHGRMAAPATNTQNHPASPSSPELHPQLNLSELTPFVDPLPFPQRLHSRNGTLRIAMRETYARLHRDVPPTRLWTYAEAGNPNLSALAPLIEARSNQLLHIEWINELPTHHFLPIDFSLHGCGHNVPEVRTVTHLHGARVAPQFDGHPEDWFVPGQSRTCTYPMHQDSTALWYHDHAMGLNRLNTYAGMFGMVLVRDSAEDALNLPSGPYELPLILCDRNLTPKGQLLYLTSGDPEHPWIPEFSGDAILVNSTLTPYFNAEPRLYRLRILNAANSRFFALSLSTGQPFHQIGTDQGLLAAPVPLKSLILAPAERADLLLDLSAGQGQTIHFLNAGQPILQFRVANPVRSTNQTGPARMPSTRQPASPIQAHTNQPQTPPQTIPTNLREMTPMPESSAILTRAITLNEIPDEHSNPMRMLLNRKRWHEPVTETPRLNTTEIWEFLNFTEDTHPMHLHLVRFQLLDRRVFDTFAYDTYRQRRYLAPALPPDPGERGWKDVVQCPPGMVTRIIVHFEGYPGRYLYHCHVLEHEANDMMRPFEVLAQER